MGRLVYLMNVSLDGYVSTPDGSVDWTVVDDELHAWFNEEMRRRSASIYGRRLYETMAAYWPHADADPRATPVMREFGRLWNATPRIVFSRTLSEVRWNSRLASADVATELERIRAEHAGELEVGGPTLAAEFIRRNLVDEYRLVVHPVVLGGGTPYFPPLDRPLRLRPSETHAFSSGAVLRAYVPA